MTKYAAIGVPHQVDDALSIAKAQLLRKQGNAFFSTIIMNTPMFWSKDAETIQTNGIDIAVNPDYFMSLTNSVRMFELAHQAMHIVYMHATRAQSEYDKELWNVACDFAINYDLQQRGYNLPPTALVDAKFKDKSAEEIYRLLEQQNQQQQQQQKDQCDGDLAPDMENPNTPSKQGDGDGDGEGEGNNNPQKQKQHQKQVEDHVKRLTTQAVQASQMAKEAGGVPGDIARLLDEMLHPKLPWDRILQRFLYSLSKTDYSWSKPNRRYIHQDIILPSQWGESIGQIDFAIDTSGSVSQSDFNRFISEIAHVFTRFKPTGVGIYQFDHILQSTDKVTTLAEFKKLKFKGGGGTNIEPVLSYFQKKSKAKALIILTDGYFHHTPAMDPKKPVVWLIYDNPNWKPPFGTCIYFEN